MKPGEWLNLHVSTESEEGDTKERPIIGPQSEHDPRETEGAVVGEVAVHCLRFARVCHTQIQVHQLVGNYLLRLHLVEGGRGELLI